MDDVSEGFLLYIFDSRSVVHIGDASGRALQKCALTHTRKEECGRGQEGQARTKQTQKTRKNARELAYVEEATCTPPRQWL
ncbi:hypothetical protein SUGI_0978570 [Cryptomeria japonica]|nr:hypothetical protein SUGI_0978570 [Cryptomeria japonica]